MLDKLNTTRPIAIIASDQHNIFVNSRALQIINITRSTPNPPGGGIERNSNGDLTGFLEENAVVPIRALMGDRGIAQLDAATVALASKKQLDEGDLVATPGQQWRNIKFFIDGILPSVSESSWLLNPYLIKDSHGKWVPGNNVGLPNANETQLQKLLTLTLNARMGLHVHASGDRAVRTMLDIATSMNRTFAPSDIGIAHAELVTAEDRARFAELGIPVIASYQWAQKATYWAGDNTLTLGADRMNVAQSSGLLNNAGALVAYGSDWPVDPLDSFLALAIGVTRAGDPQNKNSHASFGPQFVGRLDEQPALSREAALRGMTTVAATYLNSSSSIGSLEQGKFAALLILDKDCFDKAAVTDENLSKNKVLMTMVGGRAVFTDDSATFLPTEWQAESKKLDINPVIQRMKPSNILSRATTGRACGSHAGHSH
ncbi:hypothetical protein ACJQWK_01064 [Exserohilum turcicum]